ncbi:MAG: right-handed parallel beta-helix repeat-containing protein [Prevotella sp.]|nr:right-handed parallel beta-helix repeat-containing protein [Prevotella sp.]
MKKMENLLRMMVTAICLVVGVNTSMAVTTIDDDGYYFVNDFESNVPPTRSDEETAIYVEGQGEWLFLRAFVSTNSSYVRSGTQNLRLYKNGSYVVTPVLDKGVKEVTFYVGRKGKGIDVHISTDAGKNWTKVATISNTGQVTVTVENSEANRVKIANDGSGDADIDDLAVSATAFGIEAQVSTGTASNITKNTADLSGTLDDPGDQPVRELGVVWSTRTNPTVGDYKAEVETPRQGAFTVTAVGLKASTDYHYRSYAVSNAGTVYGEEKTFRTAEATMAVVATGDLTFGSNKYVATGMVVDDGGADLLEVGVLYGEAPGLTVASQKVSAKTPKAVFRVELPLEWGKTYYFRAYAITTVGTSMGEERQQTIDESVPPTPDLTEKIWCAPDGDDTTADGTEQKPFFSLDKAIAIVEPGMRICMKAGTYVYDHRINIDNKNGTEEAPIELFAVGGRAVLDFSAMPYHKHSDNPYQGVRLTSSHWHFYRIDICNASDNGLLIERATNSAEEQAHDNLIEECNFYKNGDTGLQIKNLGAFNKVINCDSYLNCDEGQGDADGFAPKLSVGDGNYFYGCRAYLNSDDGWDVFYKKNGTAGDDMTIILENCISYKNGFLDENTIAEDGNGNGFKCGSNQGAMNVYLNRCLAICNKAKGFDQNHNAGDVIMNNCTGMTLKSISDKSYSYRIYEEISNGHEVRLTNCIAINDNDATDKRDKETGLPKPGEHGKYGEYGRFEVDETLDRISVVNCEFHKADPTQFIDITNHQELIAPRGDDGQIPETTFAHLAQGSFLIDAGVPVEATTYRGIEVAGIDYKGTAPDLGAYESDDPTGIGCVKPQEIDGRLHLKQTMGGLLLVTVNASQANRPWRLTIHDAAGRQMTQKTCLGATTAISIPSCSGAVVVRADGEGFQASVKTIF